MEIRILKCEIEAIEAIAESLEEKSSSVAVIRQANSAPLTAQREPIVKPSKDKTTILSFVPACISAVTSQMDAERFEALSQCYLSSFRIAFAVGCKTILIQDFGKGLYWRPIRSAQAARKALEIIALEAKDSLIVFAVQEQSYEAWDDIMKF